MLNKIYHAQTVHKRFKPVSHQFSYPVISVAVDIKSLTHSTALSVNKWGIWSLFDSDYLMWGEGSIYSKYLTVLESFKHNVKPDSVILVTSPRYCNYVFNPVNFYYGYKENQLDSILVEVTNTYKEKHVYFLDQKLNKKSKAVIDNQSKAFHVSPFFDENGEYFFNCKDIKEGLTIGIRYDIDNQTVFTATLVGTGYPLTWARKIFTVLQYPFTIVLTMPRILWQAFLLYYKKKLPAKSKPIPKSHRTIRKWKASMIQKLYKSLVEKKIHKASKGCLKIMGPNKETSYFGDKQAKDPIQLTINDYNFYRRLATNGSIGFGESFCHGEWESPSVTNVIKFFIENEPLISNRNDSGFFWEYRKKLKNHRAKKNTKSQSKQNIEEHYDLSNDFYEKFLDPSMMYSSALYLNKSESLDDAQVNKVSRLIETLDIKEGHTVLEIGSGWGSIAIEIAKRYNVSVKTLTLSNEQYNYVKNRVKNESLKGTVEVVLQDYRDENGQYDRLISVEMIEAVGEEYLESYFNTCSQSLTPNGKMMLQAITIRDDRYEEYCKNTDWIQQYIFPGGHLPSYQTISQLINENNLEEINQLEIGDSYAQTLAHWRENFIENWTTINALGFEDSFKRKWLYYLMYCQAGFESGLIQTYQLLFSKK